MSYTFTLFDAPDAGTGTGQGTYPLQINNVDSCSGVYLDNSNNQHGFIRLTGGTLTEFDVPTASQTYVAGLNNNNDTCGWWVDGSNADHGFIRASDGTFTTFDVPSSADIQIGILYIQEAGRGVQLFSVGNCINNSGSVGGVYKDLSSLWHGFIRSSGGSYTTFDLTGDYDSGIAISSINNNGDVCGSYLVNIHPGFYNKGFIRKADGTLIQFASPSAGTNSNNGTIPYIINDNGDVGGYYADSSGLLHGFIRMADGTFIEYDVPGTTNSTLGTCINLSGQTCGSFNNPTHPPFWTHGFIRNTDGTFFDFDVLNMPSAAILNYPYGINTAGCVTGSYANDDTDDIVHGFIGCPNTPPPPPTRATRCVDTLPSGTMVTTEVTRDLDADWNSASTFIIQQSDPLPFTVRGIVLRMTYNVD